MLLVKPVIKANLADQYVLANPIGLLSNDTWSSPKSPKFNELRARYRALHKSENDPKKYRSDES